MLATLPRIFMLLVAAILCSSASAADPAQRPLQRDPFRQPYSIAPAMFVQSEGSGNGMLDLRGIIYDSRAPLANIDGQILGIGDFVAGYRLIKVEEREAVLLKNGKRIRLKLDRTPSR